MTEQKNNNKSLVLLFAVLAVLVAGYALWIAYANKKVRQVVDASVQRLETRLTSKDIETTVTYDDVNVHGLSLRPRASVYKLHIAIDDKRRKKETHIMLPEVVYTPTTFNMRSYRLEVVDSVNMLISQPNREPVSLQFDFSSLPALNVLSEAAGGVHYSFDIPQNITITEADTDPSHADGDRTDLVLASKPEMRWSENANGIPLGQYLKLPHLTISKNSELQMTIENISGQSSIHPSDTGLYHVESQFKLENLEYHRDGLEVVNPVSFVVDTVFDGALDGNGAFAFDEAPARLNIHNMALMSGLSSLFVNGELHVDAARERLPYGHLNLRVDDLDASLDYALEHFEDGEGFAAKIRLAVERLAGEKLSKGGSATIRLSREQEGRLYVGALTLEETLGVMLELIMTAPELAESPDLPQADTDDSSIHEQKGVPTEDAAAVLTDEDAADAERHGQGAGDANEADTADGAEAVEEDASDSATPNSTASDAVTLTDSEEEALVEGSVKGDVNASEVQAESAAATTETQAEDDDHAATSAQSGAPTELGEIPALAD